MRNHRIVGLLLLAAALGGGCSGGSAGSSDPTAKATEVKQADPATMAKGDNVISADATTINDPKQAKEGGSYRVAPADPNSKNFQADPKLGGGG